MSQFLTDRDEIAAWLRLYNIKDYAIHPDGVVDVNDDVVINGRQSIQLNKPVLTSIPVQFGVVDGVFWCKNNKLTSLLGCPSKVTDNFDCSYNRLTSIEYLPGFIGAGLSLDNNPIESGLLGLLLVEGLMQVRGLSFAVQNCINRHLEGDRDVFALQQELIDRGFEEYATL